MARFKFRDKLLFSYLLVMVIPVFAALLIYGVNLYAQTRKYYEDLLNQFTNRTDAIVNEVISNVARNSFFYLTDFKLEQILGKKYVQNDEEFVQDFLYIQQAMDQFVLMNGNLTAITVLAPNGRLYGSKAARDPDIHYIIEHVDGERLERGEIVVSDPYVSTISGNKDQYVSIVRKLNDLNGGADVNGTDENTFGIVKLDVKFRQIEKMLENIPDSDAALQFGTIVISGDRVIYRSHLRSGSLDEESESYIVSRFAKQSGQSDERVVHLRVGGESYLFNSVRNTSTGWTIVQYMPQRLIDRMFLVNTRNYILFSVVALAIAVFLAFFFTKRFIRPIQKLIIAMKSVDTGNMRKIQLKYNPRDEMGRLIRNYNAMIVRLQQSVEREIRSRELQRRAELNMLQAQTNPHFLYNTLNAIHSIAQLHRIEEISQAARCLSAIYRYNLKAPDVVTVGEELEQVRNYVAIQHVRFPGKFQVLYEVDAVANACKMLKSLLQPLVENAFYHGLEPKGGSGVLRIAVKERNRLLNIVVEDDGIGMEEGRVKELNAVFSKPFRAEHLENMETYKPGFGLLSVYARMKHFYGDAYWMKITSKPHAGTCVEMAIPADRDRGEGEAV